MGRTDAGTGDHRTDDAEHHGLDRRHQVAAHSDPFGVGRAYRHPIRGRTQNGGDARLIESRVGYAPCAGTARWSAGMMLSGQALAMTLGPAGRPDWRRAAATGPGRCEATCPEVMVSQVRGHNFSVSLDGFGTGAGQSLEAPFGHAGTRLHEWFFPTRTFRAMQGQPGGSTGIDDAFASAWEPGIGAEIMGRGKFGPHHGPSPDQEWTGCVGGNPPFHTPVFVLTPHLRPPVQMSGGTPVYFLHARPPQGLWQVPP